ncbi:MAG: YjgP/YjgQ family permease [Flavobacteriales bacterium]|nr:YjgP/YjgQ family permease [Flavobacteriales bacterium]
MKKLHKLIIQSYLGPFTLTFFITLFIFVMQFLWKYIDDLVGKGLEIHLVAELLFYASANLVPMALPLAILLASIMTFGSFGEHYELVAMKSSGMGLIRIMYPLLLVTMLTSVGAFLFTNYVWPKANLEFASLLYDIRHKKPAFDITEGVYYDGIDGYVIRVEKKDEDGKGLNDVLIYDHTKKKGNTHVIRAEKGRMEMSEDQNYLVFTLINGTSYEEIEEERRPHMVSSFGEEILRFDLSGFQMERSDKDIFKDNYQMLNIQQLELAIDTYNLLIAERKDDYQELLQRKTIPSRLDTEQVMSLATDSAKLVMFRNLFTEKRLDLLETATSQLRSNRTFVESKSDLIASNQRSINRHLIEWHRKFTLSFACIILFFIGAPLGAIIRKGGLGLPVVISVLFFLVFHITSISFEKLAKQGEVEPVFGMWISSAVLLPVGLFLTYKASTDSAILDMETYTKSIERFLRKLKIFQLFSNHE